MTHFLDDKKLAHFEWTIRARLLEVQTRIEAKTIQLTGKAQSEDLSDEADRAFVEESRISALNMIEHDRVLLKKLQAALSRIVWGDFGYCEECGEDIAEARLQARPEARCCVDCQSLIDTQNHHTINRAA